MAGLFKNDQEESANTLRKKGDVIAEYTELRNKLIGNADKFVSILNEMGAFFERNFPKLKWGNETAILLTEEYNTYWYKKYLMDIYMKNHGYIPNDDPIVDVSIYQTILAVNWDDVRPFCEFAKMEGRNHDKKYQIAEGYENTWHYIHSGAITINPKNHKAELTENYKDILVEYCSITVETKEEVDFINHLESYISKLDEIKEAFEAGEKEYEAAQKIIPSKIPGVDDGWDLYHLRQMDNIPWILSRSSSDIKFYREEIKRESYHKIIKCFVPVRKKKVSKCYDERKDFDDLEIFDLIGYKNPHPDQDLKERYPELYGPSIRQEFVNRLDNELRAMEEGYKKQWYRAEQIEDFKSRYGYNPYKDE